MVEFRSVVLNATEAKREGFAPAENLDININIEDMKPVGELMGVDFVYTVTYKPKAGFLKITGTVYVADKPSEVKNMLDNWKKTKALPKELGEPLLNVVNLSAGVNGVFIARALNMAPPLIPPRLQITKSGGKS